MRTSLDQIFPSYVRARGDKSIGSKDYKMLMEISDDEQKSKAFLKVLAKNRKAIEKNSSKEEDRIDYSLNLLEDRSN